MTAACSKASRSSGSRTRSPTIGAIHDPRTVYAMVEDYRAGLTVDREHDDADRAAGRRVRCPTPVAWSDDDDLEELWVTRQIWGDWADDVHGTRIDSGHHMAEEAPEELAEVLNEFVSRAS